MIRELIARLQIAHNQKEVKEHRDRMILEHTSVCPAAYSFARAWFDAEKEFNLPDENAYICIKRLLTEIEELRKNNGSMA